MQIKFSSILKRFVGGAYSTPVAIAAVIAGLCLVAITEVSYQAQRGALDKLILQGAARLEVLNAFQRLSDAESGERGYLLIHDPMYLEPFTEASEDVLRSLNKIDALDGESDDAKLKVMQKNIRELMLDKLAEMKEVMRLHDEGNIQRALEIVRAGIGREIMQELRAGVEEIMAYRSSHVAMGLEDVKSIFLRARIGVISMTLLSTLILIALIQTSRRAERDRDMQRIALQAERDRLEQLVNDRVGDLRELTKHLQTAREDERARLARELHDELGALLTSAKLDVAFMKAKITKDLPDILPKLSHLNEMLNGVISLKRRIVEDLTPSSLRTLGLVPALEILCSEMKQTCGVELIHQLQAVELEEDRSLALYRFAQEALTNMAKYAQATRAMVRMNKKDGQVCVEVWDNGKGFDALSLPTGRHGLKGMRFRIEALGGRLDIESSAEEGTHLTVWVPENETLPNVNT